MPFQSMDLTGQRFGRLTAIELMPRREGEKRRRWRCACDCGAETFPVPGDLRKGTLLSCGCWRKTRCGDMSRSHGQSKTPLWHAWANMKRRCTDQNHDTWENYGGRGINFCDRWGDFENFAADMGAAFAAGLSLERVEVNGNYEPENCIWIPLNQQQRNTRQTRWVDSPWGRLTASEVAVLVGVDKSTFIDRLNKGWGEDRLFSPPGPTGVGRQQCQA